MAKERPAAALAPGAEVLVRVRNTGSRPGREVTQACLTGAHVQVGRSSRDLRLPLTDRSG